ncbi:OapC/ArvC family zinc-ribbon domain-containing protein [Natronomonas sp.]|uniref:OapC/ArvC family zinc-ribbon domain-containing protein n=1 Tax=Natronomonas sp. TaxID=2184060 RepID=UPI002FC2A712
MPHQCTGCGHTFADGSKEMLSGCPECGGNKFQFRPSEEDLPDEPAEPAGADAPSRPDPETSSVAETVGRATTKMRDLVASGPDDPSEDAAEQSTDSTTETDSGTESTSVAKAESTTTDPESPTAEPEPTTTSTELDTDPNPEAAWPSESGDAEPDEPETGELDDDGEIIDADARRSSTDDSEEDLAQASARSEVVPEEELPETDEAATETVAGSSGLESAEAKASSPEPDVDGRVVSEPDDDEQPDIAELREQLNDQFESIKIVEPGQYELNLMELYDREEYIIALQENGRYVIQVPEQWMGEDPGER